MTRYLFVLGKNPRLSLAEIKSCFKNSRIEDYSKFCIVETNEKIDIRELGGTIKVCKIIGESNLEELENTIIEKLPSTNSEKGHFAVSLYNTNKFKMNRDIKIAKKISISVKKKLKSEGLSFKFMSYKSARRSYMTHTEIIKKKMIEDGFEIVIGLESDEKCYISKTIAVHDPFEFRKMDIGRPAQRAIYSIPPRLAIMMINLSEVKGKELIIDPFCGVGTIVQEMILKGLNCEGSDIDKDAISKAKQNIDWIKKEYGTKSEGKVFVCDAKNLDKVYGKNSVSCIVTEPYLGPPLPRHPKKRHVDKIADELTQIYKEVFKAFKKILRNGGKVVIVFPEFKTEKGMVSFETGFIEKIGFEKVSILNDSKEKSFLEGEERHRLMRRIYVFRKK